MFYKIGKLSKLVEVDAGTLRYWEKEFSALRPQKNSAGHRMYSARDVELVLRIKKLLHEEGYTISGAKRRLRQEQRAEQGSPDGGSASRETMLMGRIQRVKQMAGEILEILDKQKRLD